MPGRLATLTTCSSDFSASRSSPGEANTTPGARIPSRWSTRKR
ncbi:hypothetical protein [Streptomyces albus]|nr:hypothetical protein [Streptomyces sp. NRRL F-5917]